LGRARVDPTEKLYVPPIECLRLPRVAQGLLALGLTDASCGSHFAALFSDFASNLISTFAAQPAFEMMRRSLFEGCLPHQVTLKRYARLLLQPSAPITGAGYSDARFDSLLPTMAAYGYPQGVFFLTNDATATLPAVSIVRNRLVGYTIADSALPFTSLECGDDLTDLYKIHDSHELGTQVEMVLACPLAPGVPSFTLGMFPQRAAPDAPGVQQRIDVARREIERRGGIVLLYAADGASSQMSAMKSAVKVRTGGDPFYLFTRFGH
jgi:hypothetical protein